MKKVISKMKKIYKANKTYSLVGLVVVLIILVSIIVSITAIKDVQETDVLNNKKIEVYNLGSDNPEDSFINGSGKVESSSQAGISVETSGVVKNVSVVSGQDVVRGQLLVSISNSEVSAQLAQSEASLQIQRAQLAELERKSSGSMYVDNIENQQNVNVDNAYSKLLSEGLISEPLSNTYTQTPPVISGRYSGVEGTYKMIIRRDGASSDYKLFVFDLETVRDININKTGPTALGTRGLFVTFPDEIQNYADNETVWYVQIPNTKSASYVSNYSSYLSAKENVGVVVQQSSVSENQLNSQRAQIKQAEANTQLLRAQLAKTQIRAPFTGSIVALDVGVGEYVSPGKPVITLISEKGKQLKVFLSGDDAKNISIGNSVYVEDKEIGSISSIAKGIDSATGKIEAVVQIQEDNNNFIIGDFVNVKISASVLLQNNNDVILVPLNSVKAKTIGSVVYVVQNDGILKEQLVEAGNIRGNSIEILSGLSGNETIAKKASGLTNEMKVEVINK